MPLDEKTRKALIKKPLWLAQEMISRSRNGSEKLTEVIPHEVYDNDTVFVLFHGTANAAYAIMDRILKYEVNYSSALKRTIQKWHGFNKESFQQLVGDDIRITTHSGSLPTIVDYPMEFNENGIVVTRMSHYFRQGEWRGMTFPVLFGQWMMEVWAWWVGRINQLERMYLAELERSGEEK